MINPSLPHFYWDKELMTPMWDDDSGLTWNCSSDDSVNQRTSVHVGLIKNKSPKLALGTLK